jgi:ribosomal protein S18 acetylase RimI-like enzyme
MLKIQEFDPKYLTNIIEIIKDVGIYDETWDSEENILSMVKNNKESIFLALIDSEVAGLIQIVPYGQKVSWFFRLIVKKNFRRKGVASLLLKKAESIQRKNLKKEVGLYVSLGNQKLIDFYKKRGYKTSNRQWLYMWKKI